MKDKSKYIGMDLSDWKEIENGANIGRRQAIKDMTVAEILHREAVAEIHRLGGKTEEEIADDIRDSSTITD